MQTWKFVLSFTLSSYLCCLSMWYFFFFYRFLHGYSRHSRNSPKNLRVHNKTRWWDSVIPWKHLHKLRLTVVAHGKSLDMLQMWMSTINFKLKGFVILLIRTCSPCWWTTRVHLRPVCWPQCRAAATPRWPSADWELLPFPTTSVRSTAGSCRWRSCTECWNLRKESVNPWLSTSSTLEIPQVHPQRISAHLCIYIF